MSFQSVLDMLPGKGTGKKRQRRKDANNLLGDDDEDFEEIEGKKDWYVCLGPQVQRRVMVRRRAEQCTRPVQSLKFPRKR